MPGFARALARTLAELRLARVAPASLQKTGAPGEDLARLLTRYAAELEARSLADLSRVFELAGEATVASLAGVAAAVSRYSARLLRASRIFSLRSRSRSPAVFAAVTAGCRAM